MSEAMKHTPGPWVARRLATHDQPGWAIYWPDKGGTHMRRLDYKGNVTEQDAHLISAAPDLLAACITFAEWLKREDDGPQYPAGTNRDSPDGEEIWSEWYGGNLRICDEAVKGARAAIAKALGTDQ